MARAERIAGCIGRRPGAVCGVSSFVTLLISVVALVVGEFTVSAENGGWRSRTTAIANRQVQLEATWALDESHWSRAPVTFRRQLHTSNESGSARRLAPKPNKFLKRRLSDSALPSAPPSAPDCWNAHAGWNDPTVVYRAKDATTDLLSPAAFQQVCELEGQVLAARGYNAACRAGEGSRCVLTNGGACLAPLSTTSRLRSATPGGWSMSCAELVAEPAYLQGLVSSLASCLDNASNSSECEGTSQVGHDFTSASPSSRVLAAVFPFSEQTATDSLLALHDSGALAASSADVETAYGQQGLLEGEFYDQLADVYLESDMSLVMASMGVSLLFLLLYTRSLFMSFVGLLQVGFPPPLELSPQPQPQP